VVVGIWDTGVNLTLFQAAPERGIGFDADGNRSELLLQPLGEAQSRWVEIKETLQGTADLKAGLETPARARRTAHTLLWRRPSRCC